MQAKEWRNVVLQSIVAHSLGTGVRTTSEWSELLVGSGKAFFLSMQLDFVAYLKVVPVFCHDRIHLLLLLCGGTLCGGHGCGDNLPLTLGVNQTDEFPGMGDELAAFLSSDQRCGGRWGYLRCRV